MNRFANSATQTPKPIEPGNVIPAFFGRIVEPPRSWRDPVVTRLDELCMLEKGWDGYSAPPVSFSNAHFAMSMLTSACPPNTPVPQIAPGSSGDLQIEWHTEHADIELHVTGPNSVFAWRMVQGPPSIVEDELHLKTDFKVVAKWLGELAEARIAARSTAA